MIKHMRVAAVLLAATVLGACSNPSTDQQAAGVIHFQGTGEVAAAVNGEQLPEALVAAVAHGRGLDPTKPKQRQQAVKELVGYVLLAQQADNLKVQQQQDLAAMVEVARLQSLANVVVLAYREAHPITDKMVADDYARQVQQVGSRTYNFTQLLFRDKADAEKAAAQLAAGQSFQQVYQAWQGKVLDGQRYTRVFPRQLPDALTKALTALQPGETTPQPVHSDLGWHLLHLDSTHHFDAPPLAQVKERVRRGMQDKQARAWVDSLRKKAGIDIKPMVAPATGSSSLAPSEAGSPAAAAAVTSSTHADAEGTDTAADNATGKAPVVHAAMSHKIVNQSATDAPATAGSAE